MIKDPNPQTINQSKQHNLNQKWRPKSANKQLISQKWNRSLPKIKTQIRKSTQGRSALGLWLGFEEKKVIYVFFFFKKENRPWKKILSLGSFDWVLGRKKLESDYWKLKNTVEKVRFFLSCFVKVIFLLLLSLCSATVVFLTQNTVLYFCWEVKYPFSPVDELGLWRHVGCYLVFLKFLLLTLTYTVLDTWLTSKQFWEEEKGCQSIFSSICERERRRRRAFIREGQGLDWCTVWMSWAVLQVSETLLLLEVHFYVLISIFSLVYNLAIVFVVVIVKCIVSGGWRNETQTVLSLIEEPKT